MTRERGPDWKARTNLSHGTKHKWRMKMSKVSAMPKPEVAAKAEKPRFAAIADSIAEKRVAYETAKARVAEAREAEIAAVPSQGKVAETCNAAILSLFDGVSTGKLSRDEASAILGDTFGYNPKADGSPGKTPAGTGNSIRKRAFLLSEAEAIATGKLAEENFPKWAKGKSAEEIAPFVNELRAGSMSPTSAYEKLSKREGTTQAALPFNEKRLLEILAALHSDDEVMKIADNPALVAAYDAIAARWTAISA